MELVLRRYWKIADEMFDNPQKMTIPGLSGGGLANKG